MGNSPLHEPHQVAQTLNSVPRLPYARARRPSSSPLIHRTLGASEALPSALGKGGRLSGSACAVFPLQAEQVNATTKMEYQRNTYERLIHRSALIEMLVTLGCAALESLIFGRCNAERVAAGPVIGAAP